MIRLFGILLWLQIACCASTTENFSAKEVLNNFIRAKSNNSFEVAKEYFPKLAEGDFDRFSKPDSYNILRVFEIGKDLDVVAEYEKGDLVFEVREINPDEIIYYHLRLENEVWRIHGFDVDDSFWLHPF